MKNNIAKNLNKQANGLPKIHARNITANGDCANKFCVRQTKP